MILQNERTIHIQTKNASYVIIRNAEDHLLNFHFGQKLADWDYAAEPQLFLHSLQRLEDQALGRYQTGPNKQVTTTTHCTVDHIFIPNAMATFNRGWPMLIMIRNTRAGRRFWVRRNTHNNGLLFSS